MSLLFVTLLASQTLSATAVTSLVRSQKTQIPEASAAVILDQAGQIQHSQAKQIASGDCATGLHTMMQELQKHGQSTPMDGEGATGHEGGSNSAEIDYLARLASDELARLNKPAGSATICQTGFNFGNSAFAFLCGTSAKVVSFDLGEHPYVKPADQLIQKQFPGRHTLTLGDSTKTLPQASSLAGKCDVVFVDGGHTKEIAAADIQNFAKLAAPGALLVVDDCEEKQKRVSAGPNTPWYVVGVDAAFEIAQSAGKISEDAGKESGLQQKTTSRSVCVARYPGAGAKPPGHK